MNFRILGLAAAMLIGTLLNPASIAASPPRGSVAPPITLPDLSGTPVSTAKLAPRTLVLIFGELDHDGTRQACSDVLDVLSDPRFANDAVVPVMIIAQEAPDARLKEEAAQGRFPAVILHDPKRDAFGAYRVLVLPTVIVVDGKGKVVHSMPGFLRRSRDILTEALLTATGKEPEEQFERTIDPKAPDVPHEAVRADRLVHLGAELTKHGLYEMAEARYTEATSLVPGHIGATLGLGELMLRQNRLTDAEPLFRSVLAVHPDSVDAALGIASVQLKRGGDDLPKAEAGVKAIIDKDPTQARARYLMGQIHEQRGEFAAAMAEYRKVAELLLDR